MEIEGRNSSIGGADKFRYQGKERDEETEGTGSVGYDYFEARMYDATIGRFLMNDRYAEYYPAMSSYTGMGNNPIFYTDPTGDTLNTSNMTEEQRDRMVNEAHSQGYVVNIDANGNVTFKASSTTVNQLGGWLANVDKLSKSDVMYNLVSGKGPDGVAQTTTTDGHSISMYIGNGSGSSFEGTFLHETEHGAQFDSGLIGFQKRNGSWKPWAQLNDLTDEVAAFNAVAQAGYSLGPSYSARKWLSKSLLEKIADLRASGYKGEARALGPIPHRSGQRKVIRTNRYFYVSPKRGN